jgi:hypothetical protein
MGGCRACAGEKLSSHENLRMKRCIGDDSITCIVLITTLLAAIGPVLATDLTGRPCFQGNSRIQQGGTS